MKKLIIAAVIIIAVSIALNARSIYWELKPEPTHAEIVSLYNSLNWVE